MNEIGKQYLKRILIGGVLGVAGWLFIGWLAQPEALFGGHMKLEFTLYYGYKLPEYGFSLPDAVGIPLCGLLWFAFGAEIGVATLPFDDRGRALVLKSLAHFAAMAATLSVWVVVNFGWREVPWFLRDLAVAYAAVWGIRWVIWYFELEAIKEKLGLKPKKGGKEKTK